MCDYNHLAGVYEKIALEDAANPKPVPEGAVPPPGKQLPEPSLAQARQVSPCAVFKFFFISFVGFSWW